LYWWRTMRMMNERRFRRLHRRCRQIVVALRGHYGFPVEDIEDLKQEIALALLKREGHSDSYCLRGALWAVIDWLRKMHNTRSIERTDSVEDIVALEESGACREIWV